MTSLTITKLRVGAEAYQLTGVAQSLNDYYTGNGESTGQWIGGGSEKLGLEDEVRPDDLRAVLAGMAPNAGGLSPNGTPPTSHPRRVPGFDLTFKAPKSVSVLYAITDDPRVQGAILDATDTALRNTVGWLEREAVRVRRGSNDRPYVDAQANMGNRDVGIRELETSGLVAASFRHRTSRAGDPYLHWHVLVANMAQGADGKWSSIVHPELYRNAKAAGEIFQTVIRDELTKSLGLEWRPAKHVHEIAGVPDTITRTFSKRRAEIEAWTLATGTPADGPGNQIAALSTRRSKGEQETTVGLSERWRTEGTTAGWGPVQAEALLQTCRPHDLATYEEGAWYLADTWFDENGKPQPYERLVHPEDWISDVLRRDLTNTSTTFTRMGAVRAVANRLGAGATMSTIERVMNRLMASTQVLRLNTGNAVVTYTSGELANKERAFIGALHKPAELVGPDTGLVASLIAKRPSLGEDQADAIRALTGTRSAVSVMIGPAGTGKTFTLNVVHEAFEGAGWNVIGVAPSARAARELQDGARIRSSTMHSLMARYDNDRLDFGPNTLLVIDEAGMADIRVLESLTSLVVNAGGRVALVGDHRQLPEIGAGGGFEYAAEQAHTIAGLTVNRRQKQPWEQQALTALRDGDVADAVQAYVNNNRLHVATDGPGMIRTAVDLWFGGKDRGLDVVLQAGTNELVDRLNTAVLDRLSAPGGPLEGQEPVDFGGIGFRVGQRVVTRKNFTDPINRDVRVINGQPGTVTAIDEQTVTIELDGNDTPVTLGANYLAAGGRLSHGYAYTTHRTQGGTWDASIAVGLDGLYREGAYTALSRGRLSNIIVLTDPEQQLLQAERDSPIPRHDTGIRLPIEDPSDVEDELVVRAGRRRGKQLAHTLDPTLTVIDKLAWTYEYPELLGLAATATQRERVAFGQTRATPATLSNRLERQQRLAKHLAPGVRVKAADRGNIGVVTRIQERDATATIRFRSVDGRRAVQTMRWDDLTIIDPDIPAQRMSPRMRAWLHVRTGEHDRAQDKWVNIIQSLGGQPDDAARFAQAAEIQLERASHRLQAEIPAWLERQLGPRPLTPQGATTWDAAVSDIARHRLSHNVPAMTARIGPRPPNEKDSVEWDRVNQRIGNTRTWLLQHPDHAEPLWKILLSRTVLIRRGREVEQILDTAPGDQRVTINRLLSGQLSLTDTQQLLEDAVAAQSERSTWIVENWPHVVEAAEIGRSLKAGVFGPDTESLGDVIRRLTNSPVLHDDATQQAPWLVAALNAVASPSDDTVTPRIMRWLERVADFRDRYGIVDRDPLGQAPVDPRQARMRDQLTETFDRLFDPPVLVVEPVEEPQVIDAPEVLPAEPELESLESLVYKALGMEPPAEYEQPVLERSEYLGRELD